MVKGVDVLAEAMKPILLTHDRIHLVMVGRPENERIMEVVRQKLGDATDRLIHINRLEHKQLFPILRGAEFVVLPSRADNMPNACIEAMLVGKVVIGTRETGFDELLCEGKTGFLAKPGDSISLQATIERVLRLNKNDKKQMAEKA